jgi:hypothetical protein
MKKTRFAHAFVGPAHALAVAFTIAFCAAPRAAFAQTNYASTPLGGRSGLMGNTGVALAKDGAAPFLNPATIVRIDDAKFAFSVNMYSAFFAAYTNWHVPAGYDVSKFGTLPENASETQNRLDVLPSTLCFFFTLKGFGKTLGEDKEREASGQGLKGRQKLAACLGAVDRGAADYPALNFRAGGNAVNQAQSYRRDWSRFQVGPTFSTYLTDDIAVGFSLHGSYSSYDSYWASSNIGIDANQHAVSSAYNASASAHALDMVAIAGLTYRIDRATRLGVSLQSRAGTIFGQYSANEFSSYSADTNHAQVSLAHGDFSSPPPFRISAGLGWEWPRLSIEVNSSFYPPNPGALSTNVHVDETTADNGKAVLRGRDFTTTIDADALVNSAMGLEYFWSPEISVLGGLSSDFSAAQRLSPVSLPAIGTFTSERVNRAVLSLGIGSHGKTTEVLFGPQLAYGWGKAFAVNSLVLPNQIAVVDLNTYSVIFIIAGSADLRAIEEAVKGVQHVVDPKANKPRD